MAMAGSKTTKWEGRLKQSGLIAPWSRRLVAVQGILWNDGWGNVEVGCSNPIRSTSGSSLAGSTCGVRSSVGSSVESATLLSRRC